MQGDAGARPVPLVNIEMKNHTHTIKPKFKKPEMLFDNWDQVMESFRFGCLESYISSDCVGMDGKSRDIRVCVAKFRDSDGYFRKMRIHDHEDFKKPIFKAEKITAAEFFRRG